jgi:hypothetical protein
MNCGRGGESFGQIDCQGTDNWGSRKEEQRTWLNTSGLDSNGGHRSPEQAGAEEGGAAMEVPPEVGWSDMFPKKEKTCQNSKNTKRKKRVTGRAPCRCARGSSAPATDK